MAEINNVDDAVAQGLVIKQREGSLSDFVRKFNFDERVNIDAANPPTCADKKPGDVCFRGNCDKGERLIMFCDASKGCGGQYTFEPC
jgi:hypothetical protein